MEYILQIGLGFLFSLLVGKEKSKPNWMAYKQLSQKPSFVNFHLIAIERGVLADLSALSPLTLSVS